MAVHDFSIKILEFRMDILLDTMFSIDLGISCTLKITYNS